MSFFVDYATDSLNKAGEELCGDTVEFFRSDSNAIAVMSDGLGSGVKANILATLTAKIAITMLKEGLHIEEVVDTIAHTLPVCNVRKLAYATFTIVKVDNNVTVYAAEFDNPSLFLIRNGKVEKLDGTTIEINERKIKESIFKLQEDDILILVSDGVVHAGVGTVLSLGWRWEEIAEFIEKMPLKKMSAKDIMNKILTTCDNLYLKKPGDDATVSVMKLVKPKEVTMFSGPPKNHNKDSEIIRDLMRATGQKIICGGTASNIACRELNRELNIDMEYVNKEIPPIGYINGIDLVTEGVLTIKATIERLKKIKLSMDFSALDGDDGSSKLAKLLYENCTHLKMLVGTAVNPAHQNPSFPEELSIKYKLLMELEDIMKSLGKVVEVKYY